MSRLILGVKSKWAGIRFVAAGLFVTTSICYIITYYCNMLSH